MKNENSYELPQGLMALGIEKHFEKGSNIFKVGERISHCYLIEKGLVKIYIDHENGRRSILDFAGADHWLGELSLFCSEDFIKENKVIEDVVCLEFDLNELGDICKRNGEISFYFASYISKKLMARSYRMSEYLNYSLEKRLASFILDHQQEGKYNISHTDVSEYLNVSYRHVLFVMKKFCEEGVMKKGKGYVVTDMKGLEKISENS
jgi:CRP-like cAMP-binding protein